MAKTLVAGSVILDLKANNKEFKKNLSEAKTELKSIGDGVDSFNSSLTNLATGGLLATTAAVGTLTFKGFDLNNQLNQSFKDLQSQTGASDIEVKKLNDSVTTLWKKGFVDNVGEAKDALIAVRTQMRGLSNNELEKVTESTLKISKAYKQDYGKTIDAVTTLTKEFGISNQEAFNMIAQGFKSGLDRSGDFLDSIGEYSVQFRNGGASADEFFNIIASGAKGGILGVDKASDMFKEFVVRINDGSKTTAKGLESLGINSEKMLTGLASGAIKPVQAFEQVIKKLNETDDQAKLMQSGVALLGTQFEDLGSQAVLAIDTSSNMWSDNSQALDDLNIRYESFGAMATQTWRDLLLEISPYTQAIFDFSQSKMPMLRESIGSVSDKIDFFIQKGREANDFYQEHKALIDTTVLFLGSLAGSIWIVTTAISTWQAITKGLFTAQMLLNGAFLASPIGWVTLGIAGLITAGVLLWKNWDTLGAKFSEVWGGIKQGGVNTWEGLKAGFRSYVNFFVSGWNRIIDGVNSFSIEAPDWVPGMGGKGWSPSIPRIPTFRKGVENFSGGIAKVHSNELLVNMPANTSVLQAGEKLKTGGDTYIINNNFEGAMVDEQGVDKWFKKYHKVFIRNKVKFE